MTENIPLAIAFGAGVLSFSSPCVLAMLPVYVAILGGQEAGEPRATVSRSPLLLNSVAFVAGFSIIFIGLGTVAGLTGLALNPDYRLLNRISGSLLIAFGLFMLAALKVPWLNFERRIKLPLGGTTGWVRSLLIGATFSLGWTACIGPILGGILVLASTTTTAWQGTYLLSVYSLGLGLPFIVAGLAFDWAAPLLKRLRRAATLVSVVSGLLLIAVGILVLTNSLTRVFSF